MIGAILGDIVGSVYEQENIKTEKFELLTNNNTFTDDSVLTCAISRACLIYQNDKDLINFKENCKKNLKLYGLMHLNARYSEKFLNWLMYSSDKPFNSKPYNSLGNGSAMRVSPVAYVANTLEEALTLAEISASITHNHPEGIAGAQAIAGSIWLLLNGVSKKELKEYIENTYYSLDFTLDDIREDYTFDVTCKGSVPQSIEAFLESENFEDAIRKAISIGGDSDTIACMTGSLAEAFYGVPKELENSCMNYLDDDLKECVGAFYSKINIKRKNK